MAYGPCECGAWHIPPFYEEPDKEVTTFGVTAEEWDLALWDQRCSFMAIAIDKLEAEKKENVKKIAELEDEIQSMYEDAAGEDI
jgi:hypothetical protein